MNVQFLDSKITPKNFDLEEMQEILSAILFSSDRKSDIVNIIINLTLKALITISNGREFQMASLFKLLNVLATHYKVNLIKNQVVESVFSPFLKLKRPKYFKIPIGDISMYLEFLALLSTLYENQLFDTKPNIFQENNTQFLVAMSIKHGNTGNELNE